MNKINNKEFAYIDNKSQKADIQKKIADIQTLKKDLELGDNKIFEITVNGFVFAKTREEIIKLNSEIIKNLNSINVKMTSSMGQQQNMLNGGWCFNDL